MYIKIVLIGFLVFLTSQTIKADDGNVAKNTAEVEVEVQPPKDTPVTEQPVVENTSKVPKKVQPVEDSHLEAPEEDSDDDVTESKGGKIVSKKPASKPVAAPTKKPNHVPNTTRKPNNPPSDSVEEEDDDCE